VKWFRTEAISAVILERSEGSRGGKKRRNTSSVAQARQLPKWGRQNAITYLPQKSRFIGVIFLFASKCGNKRGKQFFCTTSESTRARDFLRYNAYIT
jgi:hypothetical protein